MAIVVPILSKYDPRGVREAERELEQFGRSVGDFAKKAALGIGIAVGALGAFALSAVKAAEEAQQENQRIEQIARSMNLFGDETSTVVKRLDEYASKVSRATAIDDGQIKVVQAKLLTFEELAKSANTVGGSFDRATKAALDLEKAGFGDAASNAVQLGKALQDPIKGLTALTRSGVTFTEEQQDLIKELVRTNRTLEAQDLILGAIERQVGGTAEATATASGRMKVAFDELKESIGVALLPLFERLATKIVDELIPAFEAWWEKNGPQVIEFLEKLAKVVARIVDELLPVLLNLVINTATAIANWWGEQETLQGWLDDFATWLEENPQKVQNLAIALLAVWGALKLLAIIQGVIALFGALSAFASATATGIGTVVTAITGAGGLITALIGLGGFLLGTLVAVDRLKTGFETLGRVAGRVVGEILYGDGFSLGDLIPGGFSPGGLRPGEGFLPFAQGGVVTGPTLGLIGEAGPEAVIPLDRLGEMGGVNVTVNGAIDPVSVANQINRILQQRGYRNGVLT